jgi:hypothetical protein
MRYALFALALAACASASSGTADSNGSVGDGGVVDSAPDANTCAMQPCSILPQCGCTNGACDIDGSDLMGTACRPITSPGIETTTCNGPKDCDHGYVCLGGSSQASCHKYCSQNSDCGTPRGQCVIDITSGGMPIAGIPPACSSNCDPTSTNPAECPATFKCGLFTAMHNGAQVKISDCSKAGTGTQGVSCKSGTVGDDTLCGKGYLCTTFDASPATNFNCRRICTVAPNSCGGGLTCNSFATKYIIAGVEYGVCN